MASACLSYLGLPLPVQGQLGVQITWGRGEDIGGGSSVGDYVAEADLDLSMMDPPDGWAWSCAASVGSGSSEGLKEVMQCRTSSSSRE